MIVRDEGRILERCLASFAGAYDELCIVDTGSQDATPGIIARSGARTRSFTGCNGEDGKIRDFSLARNASIDLAGGDWILWMDADDVLRAGGADRIRRHAVSGKHAGVQVTIQWGRDSWLQTRMFRNDPANRFVGRVHEYPKIEGKLVTDREIVIEHRPDKAGKESSVERNLRMCGAEVREDPTNKRALFYLANALRIAGRHDEAIARYSRYLALGGNFHCERFMAAHYIAVCQLHKRAFAEAVAAGMEALRIDPRYAEAHCLIADAYAGLGEKAYALQWYRSALACGAPPPDASLFVDRTKYGEHPKKRIAQLSASKR